MLRKELEIINERGLHARASAKFVACVEMFNAQVSVTKGDETVSGLSIMGLLMLGAGIGSTIIIETDGQEAQEVMDALTTMIANKFDEEV